jgi:hypothetical protein
MGAAVLVSRLYFSVGHGVDYLLGTFFYANL